MEMLNLYIVTLIFNFFLFFYFYKIVKIYNVFDNPNKLRKIHKNKTSLAGGLLIYISVLFISLLFPLFNHEIIYYFFQIKNFLIFLFVISLFFILGFLDDKFDLNPWIKLFFSFIFILILILSDPNLKINFVNFSIINKKFEIGQYSFFFTILCFLLFTNAFNMFDGINLQAGLYSVFLLLSLSYYSNSLFFQYILCLLPTIFVFLIYNVKSKVFLGNSGSLLLSFLISYMFIKVFNFDKKIFSDEIFFLLLHPGIDMLRLFLTRLFNFKNPFSADQDHFHHNLLKKFNYKKTLIVNMMMSTFPFFLFKFLNSYYIFFIYLFVYIILIFYLKNFQKNIIK